MSTSGECKLMSLGFHPPAISICISGPARTQNIERRRQQLRRAPAITIQIYTLRPLNSIAGADPLLFSLDYASCGPHHVTLDTWIQDDPIVLASPVHLGGRLCRQLWTTALSFHLALCWCVSRIQGPRRCPVNRAQRPGNPPLDVSFPELGRRCDIIGRSHKARHLSTWCIHPTGPGSCLHLTRGSKSLLTAALATTVNVERRNNATT